MGERRSGDAGAGEQVGTARRATSGLGKWKKPGRWRPGRQTRTAHARSLQELRGRRSKVGRRGVPQTPGAARGPRWARGSERSPPRLPVLLPPWLPLSRGKMPEHFSHSTWPAKHSSVTMCSAFWHRLLTPSSLWKLIVWPLTPHSAVPCPFPLPLGWPLGRPKP